MAGEFGGPIGFGLSALSLRLGSRKLVGARALPFGLNFRLARTTTLEIGAIARLQLRGEVGSRIERARLCQPQALMGEPALRRGVGFPIARRPLDALEGRQTTKILGHPTLEQAPLTQQRLMRRLDRHRSCAGAGLRIDVDLNVG